MSLEINPKSPKKPVDGAEIPLLGEMFDELDKAIQTVEEGKPRKPKPHAPAGAVVSEPQKETVTSDTEK